MRQHEEREYVTGLNLHLGFKASMEETTLDTSLKQVVEEEPASVKEVLNYPYQIETFQYNIEKSLELKTLNMAGRVSVVQIPLLVKGSYVLPNKGVWVINDFLMERIEINFKNNVLGFAPALYKGHDHLFQPEEPPAHGFMFDCFREGDVLYSLFEVVNPQTYEEIKSGYYRHASVEYYTYAQDRRTGEEVGALLTAVALTNSPFVVDMPSNKVLSRLQDWMMTTDLGCIRTSRQVVLSLMPERKAGSLISTTKHTEQQVGQVKHMDEQTMKELQALREETERLRLEAERARSEAAVAKEALAQIHLQNLQHCINKLSLPSELKTKAFALLTSSEISDELQEQLVEFLGEVLDSAMELQKRTSQYGVSNPTSADMELPKPYQNIIQRNRQTKKLAQLS